MKASPTSHELDDQAVFAGAIHASDTFEQAVTTAIDPVEGYEVHQIDIVVDDVLIHTSDGDKRLLAYSDRVIDDATLVADIATLPKEAGEFDLVWSTVTEEAAESEDFTDYELPAFLNATKIEPLTPGISEAQPGVTEVSAKTSFRKKALAIGALLLASISITQAGDTAPANADTGHHSVVDTPNQPFVGKMSAKQAYDTCKEDVLIVSHAATASEGNHSKYDVDTVKWIEHEISLGHVRIELDEQVSKDGVPFGQHDRMLQENTNGKGVAHSKESGYLFKLKTPNGERMASADDLIEILQKHPEISFQHEFKDYDSQWTGDRLQAWFQKFTEAGVMDQIYVSSASSKVIRWFSDHQPEYVAKNGLQLIGFANYLPNLQVAKKIGATQVNVTSEAALRGGAAYMKQAKRMGMKVSVRSSPTGQGDDGHTWLAVIEKGADQIVTQGVTKYFVCKAVRKAAAQR